MDGIYTVYLHKLPIEVSGYENDRYYIGTTRQTLQKRWNLGFGYKTNNSFWADIVRFGWNNFEHEVVAMKLDKEEAGKMERRLIAKYNSIDPGHGYNKTTGGDNLIPGVEVADSVKEKHAKDFKRRWEDEDFRKKISENSHLHTDKYIFKGKDNATSQKTILLNTMEVFDCQRDGARAYGVSYSVVSKCCGGKARCGGKHKDLGYLVWMKYEEYKQMDDHEIAQRLKRYERPKTITS